MKELFKKAFEFHVNNELEKAEELYLKCLESSSNVIIYEYLANLYNKKQEFNKTVALVKDLPDKSFEIYFELAFAYKNLLNIEEAKEAYKQALALNQTSQNACFNIANLYLLTNEPHISIEYYKKCLELNPNDREAKYFLSLGYFRTKDYENGFPYFEQRLCRQSAIECQKKTYPNLMAKAPVWCGEDISSKTLYTYYEAGFGDMIMFARYLPLLKAKCKKLIFKPQQELYSLFKENFPDIEIMNNFEPESDLQYDCHLPLLSAPYMLNLTNDNVFVTRDKYLKSNPEKAKEFKQKYFDNDKFKIAIKWQGNTFYETDRVINAEAFYPLFDIDDVKIYSAQTFAGAEEVEKLKKYDVFDLSKTFNDFSDTAAAIENLDLIICNDTSLAHLAAAMGKPAWVLLPFNYNWRWHVDLNHCDWYDNVKLFRLEKNQTWNDIMANVCEELTQTFL